MLRKFAHITLSFLLLAATAGVSITWEYCGNTLKKVTLKENPASSCNMDGCCHNETAHYQVKENFTTPPVVDHVKINVIAIPAHGIILADNYSSILPEFQIFKITDSPPKVIKHTHLSFLQTFLI